MVGREGAAQPAPRVTACVRCGVSVTAGARGPLPRWCELCRQSRTLHDRIASARNEADAHELPDVVAALDEAAALTERAWTRFGE